MVSCSLFAEPLLRVELVFAETQECSCLEPLERGTCRGAVIVCCRTKFRISEQERCR